MKRVYVRSDYQQQQGMVLVIALIILFALSIIALVTLQSSSMSERITGNMRQLSVAMQTASSALREAEQSIQAMTNTTAFASNANGLYSIGQAPNPFTAATWTGTASLQSTASYPASVQAPRYFIQYLGTYSVSGGGSATNVNVQNYGYTSATGSANVGVYRIVARGTGGGKAQVIYESFYAK